MKEPDAPGPNTRASDLTLLRITPADAGCVRLFFQELSGDPETCSFFHPHPFTPLQADKISNYTGMDYYAAVIRGDRMIGYGMLRGWDEGYEIPTLGIVVSSSSRGLGLGRLIMEYLHVIARARNVRSIMLKVYKKNEAAVRLYRGLGYVLSDHDQEWKGVLEIGAERRGAPECGRAGCK